MMRTMPHLLMIIIAGWANPMFGAEAKQKAQLDIAAAEQQCAEGHLGLCMRLGMHYEKLGKIDQATGYFTRACEGDDAASCLRLADFAEQKQDQKMAMHWLRRACRSEKGDGTGCYRIANYATAMNSPKNAETWLKKACAKGHSDACAKCSTCSK